MPEVSTASEAPLHLQERSVIMRRFADAFRVRPWVYWTDMLGTALGGWTLFVLAVRAPTGSPAHVVGTLASILVLLRAALFIHEIAHLRRGQLPGFEAAWNALVGVPALVPSLMYVGSHMDHHRRNGYGTDDDPEYAPIARWGRFRIALFVLTVAFVPLVLVIRWGVLGPLSRACPALRPFVVGHLSTLMINHGYRRPAPTGFAELRWRREEIATALFVWAVGAGVAAGWIPWVYVAQWFVVVAGVLVVNQVRTLAAHGYENDGRPVDSETQLLDSINLTGFPFITALVAPVGLRYHALHHYLPTLPYHSLGIVHRRLLAELPPDAPYHRTSRASLVDPIQKLWNDAPA